MMIQRQLRADTVQRDPLPGDCPWAVPTVHSENMDIVPVFCKPFSYLPNPQLYTPGYLGIYGIVHICNPHHGTVQDSGRFIRIILRKIAKKMICTPMLIAERERIALAIWERDPYPDAIQSVIIQNPRTIPKRIRKPPRRSNRSRL
jgi:hypothetical protein